MDDAELQDGFDPEQYDRHIAAVDARRHDEAIAKVGYGRSLEENRRKYALHSRHPIETDAPHFGAARVPGGAGAVQDRDGASGV